MKFILIAAMSLILNGAFAQASGTASSSEASVSTRFIQVNGYSERELSPDIIYVSITIKEYFTDNTQKQKTNLEDLEKSFLRTLYNAGVNSSNISIESISGYTNWGVKKKSDVFLASKRYQLKLNDLDMINGLMSKVDPKAIASMYISGYDYTKMADVKKQLRIEALKDARTKASYMLNALNENVGAVLEVEDQDTDSGVNKPLYMSRALDASSSQSQDIEFKKVKVSSTIRVKFLIK